MKYIQFFSELSMDDILLVGGKNAALGEMIQHLSSLDPQKKMQVPHGFAIVVQAYWDFLNHNNLLPTLHKTMARLSHPASLQTIQEVGKELRALIMSGSFPEELADDISKAYVKLSEEYGHEATDVAVRSSATAEDLPHASFAGQQDTFLHIKGIAELLEATKKCMASLFTDRAIVYRTEQHFDHFQVGISVGIQKMIRSDKASSGVAFSLDTDTGFKHSVVITSSYGLGENIVKGVVNPDEFHVHKPTLALGKRPIIKKFLGSKEVALQYLDETHRIENLPVLEAARHQFSLSDDEILELARQVTLIEEYYTTRKGGWCPMDIEWAKDAQDNHLYIVQARPETIHSQHEQTDELVRYALSQAPAGESLLTKGLSIGQKIATGKARILNSISEINTFNKGDILVTSMTDPDWVPLMKKASAIITDKGGRTCHAAIVSRELGIPAIIGTSDATERIKEGEAITADASHSSIGYVYKGTLDFTVSTTVLKTLPKPRVPIMLNIADPDRADKLSFLPVSGVGLARIEFIVTNAITLHPMAVCKPSLVKDPTVVRKLQELSLPYGNDPERFFIDTLAQGIGMIAAAFYPRPVVVRLSDFKTNEYRNLIGGEEFEPLEENPMLGFRGAARYCDPSYAPAFALECAAIKKAREEMGFTNIKLLIPFVRNLYEAGCTLARLEEFGLRRGSHNLEILMMCEVPSNVILLEELSLLFDGFSIGSNDLTQFTLAVDRDSEKLSQLFNEQDLAVQKFLIMALEKAKKAGTPMSICGQAPSDFPEIADLLIKHGINALSLNPDSVIPFLMNEPDDTTH